MKQCMHKIETVKVPKGNAFGLLLPFKTARWEDAELVPDNIDIRYLEDVVIMIDDQPWEDYEMDERGPIVHIGADDFDLGAHNATIEATYAGVAIRGAFYECFTIVEWSFESNVEQHLPDSPLIAETSYVYIGITDDEELEALKQQYREATAACETARLEYEAAKEEFDEKAEALEECATDSHSAVFSRYLGTVRSHRVEVVRTNRHNRSARVHLEVRPLDAGDGDMHIVQTEDVEVFWYDALVLPVGGLERHEQLERIAARYFHRLGFAKAVLSHSFIKGLA